MPSFNLAEDFYHLHLLISHLFPLPALSLTIILEIVSLACKWGGGILLAICFDYMYTEWTGCRNALISTTNAFLAAPPRQAICFHFLAVLQKIHFTHEAICLAEQHVCSVYALARRDEREMDFNKH